MTGVPSNLIPSRVTQLPTSPVASEDGWLMYVYQGNSYKIRAGDLLSVSGVPVTRQVIAGTGLTGGGQLSSNITISIAPGGVGTTQLAVSGVTAGVYGSATQVPVLTIDATGRVTAATTTSLTISGYVPDSRQVIAGTGLSGGGALSSNVTLTANLSNATPNALFSSGSAGVSTDMSRADHKHPAISLSTSSQVSGVLGLQNGGTGNNISASSGAIIYSGSDGLYAGPVGASGQLLQSNGTGAYSFVNQSTITAGKASNIVGGVANELVYQSGVDTTAFIPAPTIAGTYLKWNGSSFVYDAIAGGGTVTSVDASGGTTGLSFTGGPITLAGTLTLSGTLITSNGGTGLTSYTAGDLLYYGSGTALSALGIGTLTYILTSSGSAPQWSAPSGITVGNATNAVNAVNATNAVSATTATNLANGAANRIAYQTGSGSTSFIVAPTVANTFLEWSGSAYQWSTNPLGTVTSVGLALPTEFSITNSPVTSSGTLTGAWNSQSANLFLASPNGSSGTPSFRGIAVADVPTLNQNTTGTASNVTGIVAIANGGTGASTASTARSNLGAAASGANSDITSLSGLTGGISTPSFIQFSTSASPTPAQGMIWWDGTSTLEVQMTANVTGQTCQSNYFYVKASSAIAKGELVSFTGVVGASGIVTAAPAGAGITNPDYIMGFAAENIALNGYGLIQQFGTLRGFDTSAFVDGDILWYNPTSGGVTSTYPTSGVIVTVAAVVHAGSGGSGSILIRPTSSQRVTAGTGISISQSTSGVQVSTANIPNSSLTNSSITINGNAVSLGGSTTVTANTPSTLTFNNGGLGGASGSTFNGGSALTVSYNTIGASPLAGSTSLTTLGTITTGVWNGTAIANAYLANSTISGVSLGSNLYTLTFGTHLTGTSYNGSAAVTIATDATNLNTASTIVARDASGNFTAGTITATLTGNASSATNLAGGAASQIPYQTGSGATTFLANGTAGQVLTSAGASAPTWSGINGGTF